MRPPRGAIAAPQLTRRSSVVGWTFVESVTENPVEVTGRLPSAFVRAVEPKEVAAFESAFGKAMAKRRKEQKSLMSAVEKSVKGVESEKASSKKKIEKADAHVEAQLAKAKRLVEQGEVDKIAALENHQLSYENARADAKSALKQAERDAVAAIKETRAMPATLFDGPWKGKRLAKLTRKTDGEDGEIALRSGTILVVMESDDAWHTVEIAEEGGDGGRVPRAFAKMLDDGEVKAFRASLEKEYAKRADKMASTEKKDKAARIEADVAQAEIDENTRKINVASAENTLRNVEVAANETEEAAYAALAKAKEDSVQRIKDALAKSASASGALENWQSFDAELVAVEARKRKATELRRRELETLYKQQAAKRQGKPQEEIDTDFIEWMKSESKKNRQRDAEMMSGLKPASSASSKKNLKEWDAEESFGGEKARARNPSSSKAKSPARSRIASSSKAKSPARSRNPSSSKAKSPARGRNASAVKSPARSRNPSSVKRSASKGKLV